MTWSYIALPGGVGVARGDRLDDLAVLAGRDRHQPAVGEIEAAEQAQLLDELPVDRGQLAVAGELDEAIVEAQVEEVVVVRVLGLDRLLHLLDEGADLLQRRRRDRDREAAADELVHRRAQVEDLDRLVDGQVADEDAAVLLGPHQAGFVEHPERLAQRPARDAEAGGKRHLGELLAGAKLAREDHSLELALDDARERARLQERDGRVRRGGRGEGGHGRSRSDAAPIVNNIQKTVDFAFGGDETAPGRASSRHRTGIGFAHGSAPRDRSDPHHQTSGRCA